MKILKDEDFNYIFWKILGVSQKKRVFHPKDVFSIERDIYKDNIYDSDNSLYKNFLKNLVSPKSHLEINLIEIRVLQTILKSYSNNSQIMNFNIRQIELIISNYKMLTDIQVKYKKNQIINILSLQFALIIEYIKAKNFDITFFEKIIEKQNFTYLVDFIKKKSNLKDDIGLAHDMSIKYEELFVCQYNKSSIQVSKYKTEISLWKNGRKSPSFSDLSLILVSFFNTSEKFREKNSMIFLQLLILRSIFYLQQNFPLFNKKFTKSFNTHRKKIEHLFKTKDFNRSLYEYQKKNKILNIYYYENILNNIEDIRSKSLKEFEELYEDDILLPSKKVMQKVEKFYEEGYDLFLTLFNEKQYTKALDVIKDYEVIENQIPNIILAIKFVIFIKMKKTKEIKKTFNLVDKKLYGGIISYVGEEYNAQVFINEIINIDDYPNCINSVSDLLKRKISNFSKLSSSK